MNGWELFQHISEREVLHFFAAYGIIHMSIWAIVTYHAKPQVSRWFPHTLIPMLVMAGMITLIAAYFREPWDVAYAGDPWWKSWVDWGGWFLGLCCGGYDAYRKLLFCDGKSREWVRRFTGKFVESDVIRAGSDAGPGPGSTADKG